MDETEFDLRSIFGLLRRQIRLILITLVAVIAAAAIFAFSLTPVYTSSALILVDPSSKNLLDPEAQMRSTTADSARIDSEVELVRSDNVLLKVVEQKGLINDEEFGVSLGSWARILGFLRLAEPEIPSGIDALNQVLANLRSAVHVQRRGQTYLISVQVSSRSREKAAELANAMADAYIGDQLASKVDSAMAARDILQARTDQALQAIASSENSYDTFIEDNIERISQNTGRTDLIAIQRQIEQLGAARSQTNAMVDTVQSALRSGDMDAVARNLQSEAISSLERQRAQLTSDLAAAASGSETSIDLRAELAAVEQRMQQAAETELTTLLDAAQGSQSREDSLRQSLRSQVLDQSLPPEVLTRLYELQQNAELARRQYQTLLSRAQELEAQADLQLADSRIVSPALAPQSPAFPNKTLILTLAAFAGLGLGVALAFLYENLIGGFTSDEQIEQVLKIPVATSVPRERGKSERESLSNIIVQSPLSSFAEAVRRTRSSLEQEMRANHPKRELPKRKVIMVTSTAPNEGKTTLSLSLARSYALSGQRTLLIDCDLRKPSLHRHLGLEPSKGLLDFLNSDEHSSLALQSIISYDDLTSVTAILGARRSDLPTDQLLAGASFERLIDAARNSFEVVVLDTPPVGPVVDGQYVAPHVDAIVYVARWASTSQVDARKGVAGLMAAKRPEVPIVCVLNQQDETKTTYYRKYGGYYSSTT